MVHVTYKGRSVRIIPDYSMETLKPRKVWTEVVQTLRNQRCQDKLLNPAKVPITIDGEYKIAYY